MNWIVLNCAVPPQAAVQTLLAIYFFENPISAMVWKSCSSFLHSLSFSRIIQLICNDVRLRVCRE